MNPLSVYISAVGGPRVVVVHDRDTSFARRLSPQEAEALRDLLSRALNQIKEAA